MNNDGTIYGLRVRGADGNTILYDENGVYREGITDGSINNDKIAGDANIDGGKLNIHSVIDNINKDGTGTIHGTKIDIDGESVSSKVFKIELNQDEQSETIERQQAEIDQNKEQIKLKVSNQKYTEDMASMTSKLEKAESEIEILNEGIKLTASKTEVQNQISNVKDFVSSEIGDISVGGANYLNNSAPRKATVDNLVTWDRTLNGTRRLTYWQDYNDSVELPQVGYHPHIDLETFHFPCIALINRNAKFSMGTRRLTYWQDYNDSVELPQVGYHPHIDLETFHFPCIALINRNAKFSMANRELSLRHEIHKAEEVIIPNETYVISFDAYSDTSLFSFHGGFYHKNVESDNYNYHSGRMDVTIEQEHVNTWQRYSFTFTTHKGIDTSQPIYLVINGHNNPEGSGYIKNIKLERSNIVSQWTPSQFDIDDSLDDVVNDMLVINGHNNPEGSGYIKNIKLERSNIVSQWTPSQFDIDDSLDDVVNDMKEYTNESIKTNNATLDVRFDGITGRVEATEKDVNGVKGSISEVNQKADSISSTVTDLSGKYTELKQTVDGIDVTGKVSFYDLKTAGATVINGSNITTGTLDTNRVNIKGGTTKKIVIANDNYCVYDGSETDVNRKVFIGFRTNVSTNVPSVMLGYNGINPSVDGANDNYCVYDGSETDVNRKVFIGFRTNVSTNVPSVMLGYNGINPSVDGAVVSGGTYTTYSHYPNNNNPESINLSYGALAFKYGAGETQFSTLNMYQSGDIDLKAGKSIYFRPNLRAKNNHVFAITDTSVGCRVPFKCTSSIYSNGDITTDRGLNASSLDILNVSINSNGIYTTGHVTGGMIKTDSYRFTNNHIAFGKNDYNNNMMNGCNWDWQYFNLVNVKVYPVALSLPTIDDSTTRIVSETQKDTLSQIKFPEARELSVEKTAPPIDISDVTNKEEITTSGDVDLIKLVYLLVKDVQELKQENKEFKKLIKGEN